MRNRPSSTAIRSLCSALMFALGAAAIGYALLGGSGSSSAAAKPARPARHVSMGPWRPIPDADGTFIHATEVAEAYSPATKSWRELATPPKTQDFCRRSAVWTGKEMLVWGCEVTAYDPATDTWRRLPDAPTRQGITVWTGQELIGWGGGCCGDADSTGSAYNPTTNTWRKLAASPLAPSQSPAGAWNGHELVLFVSGLDPELKPVPGAARAAAYDPSTDTWRLVTPVPERGQPVQAVWDGREIVALSFQSGSTVALAKRPATDRWHRIGTVDPGRGQEQIVWTGRELLFWTAETSSDGLGYWPKKDRWDSFPLQPLEHRSDPAVAWTGRELIVFGGIASHTPPPVGAAAMPRYLADGASYRPPAHAPPPMPVCCGG